MLSQPQFYKDLTRKTSFFEEWSWFKSNNLALAQDANLEFYTSVAKGSILKVRKFLGIIPTFVEVLGEKRVGVYLLIPFDNIPLTCFNHTCRNLMRS